MLIFSTVKYVFRANHYKNNICFIVYYFNKNLLCNENTKKKPANLITEIFQIKNDQKEIIANYYNYKL